MPSPRPLPTCHVFGPRRRTAPGHEPSVLLVDDDADLRDVLRGVLVAARFTVREADTGRAALDAVARDAPDVILLDLGLPDVNGFDLLDTLVMRGGAPVIVLSAWKSEAERVLGLELGADDYVTKPFSNQELLARIRRALSRQPRPAARVQLAGLTVDTGTHEVLVEGTQVTLTAREFALLTVLASEPRRVFSAHELLAAAWEQDPPASAPAAVAEHVYRLRRKLRGAHHPAGQWIENVRGVGYRLAVPTDALAH